MGMFIVGAIIAGILSMLSIAIVVFFIYLMIAVIMLPPNEREKLPAVPYSTLPVFWVSVFGALSFMLISALALLGWSVRKVRETWVMFHRLRI